MSDPRSFTAVVNPVAGSGTAYARWSPVAARLASAGADVRVELSHSAAHAAELAATAAAAGRVVVAVGGDGLVRDVAGGIVKAVPSAGILAIVAVGRVNDLARRLGLPTDDDGLTDLLRSAPAHPFDVLDAGGVIVPGNVYAGVDSVADAAATGRRITGALGRRAARSRAASSWSPASYALSTDGRRRAVIAHTVVVANSGIYRDGQPVAPAARTDDGLLDLVIAGGSGTVSRFLRDVRTGRHVDRPEVEVHTAHEVRIAADRELPVFADGDRLGTLPVTVRIRPGALRMLLPPAASGE